VEEYRKLEEEQISSFCAALDTLAEEPPGILVQPRRNAKGGKFDCALMSLNVLLDYRREDKKEHLFEVVAFFVFGRFTFYENRLIAHVHCRSS